MEQDLLDERLHARPAKGLYVLVEIFSLVASGKRVVGDFRRAATSYARLTRGVSIAKPIASFAASVLLVRLT